jgi:hypothetical protein
VQENNMTRSKYTFNKNYFETNSHNMAWILGFSLADATIDDCQKKYPSVIWHLSEKDIEIIEFIKTELESNKPISRPVIDNPKRTRKLQTVRFTICSKKICDDLARFGVVPRKTGREYISDLIPKELLPSFVRGVFDGDGWSSNYVQKGRVKCIPGICCSNINFLKSIRELIGCGGITSTPNRVKQLNFG